MLDGDLQSGSTQLGGDIVLPGEDGWSLRFAVTDTQLLVQRVRGAETEPWQVVLEFADLVGPRGPVPLFAVIGGSVVYRFAADESWSELFALAEVKGEQGLSAYQVWLAAGNAGTVADYLTSIKGAVGAAAQITSATAVGGAETKVEVGGTPTNRTFTFTIKEGKDGTSTTIANVTAVSVPYGQPAAVTSGGTALERTYQLSIPEGPPGPQGAGGTPNVDLVGSVPPNGAVTAQPLTVYKNTAAGARVQMWLKEAGTGNTGWAPLRISTGWINVTSLQDPARTVLASSSVLVRRDNDQVTLEARIVQTTPSSSTVGVLHLPEGFWPISGINQPASTLKVLAWRGTVAEQATFNWYQAFGSLRGFSIGTFSTTARTWDISASWYSPQTTIAI